MQTKQCLRLGDEIIKYNFNNSNDTMHAIKNIIINGLYIIDVMVQVTV